MILKQYYLGCLAHASYLVADEESRVAAVVDPQRDIDQYVADAAADELEIRYVFLTHFHADFVAGHLELRDRFGAEIGLGSKAAAEYAFLPLSDGDVVELGPGVRLSILETPGHSPESISLLVFDRTKNDERLHAVLTGDTLFIGDVGRPDLRASVGWTSEELGAMLFDSLHEKLLPLPDETLVYPGHGAGSLCGKNLSTDTVSTMGVQRLYNVALQATERDEFVRLVTTEQPFVPDYFTYNAVLNTKERPTLETTLERELTPLSLDEMLAVVEEGGQLLDVREPAEHAGAHVRGSINVSLDGSFATWCGTILDQRHRIVVIAEPGREKEATVRLGRIGFDIVAGYLDGGMQALDARPDLLARGERITAPALAERLASEQTLVLDVRTATEVSEGRIPASLHVPLNEILERITELPRDRRIVVTCASGYRSAIAVSLLERAGIENVSDLVGGTGAWEASRLETTSAS